MVAVISPSGSRAARAAETYNRSFVIGMCRTLAGLPGFASPGLLAEAEAAYAAVMFLGIARRPVNPFAEARAARFTAAAVAVVGRAEAVFGRETVATVCGV